MSEGKTTLSPEKQPISEIQGDSVEIREKTGELVSTGANLKCIDCETEYPLERNFRGDNHIGGIYTTGKALCNGHVIDKCPWCRPDSAPWKDGRGI